MNNFNSSVTQSSSNPQSFTDQNLYFLCKTYGARALEWRRKFTGLLPEVNRRKLYEKKGFESIFVFAKKLAGLSEDQVSLTLNLEKRFENLPALWSLLVNGEVSVNKLARVASIATVENQEFLAEKVRILSKSAVETLVRDEKWAGNAEGGIPGLFGDGGMFKRSRFLDNFDGRRENVNGESVATAKNQNGLFEPRIGLKFVPGHKSTQSTLGEKWSSAENGSGLFEPKIEGGSVRAHKSALSNTNGELVSCGKSQIVFGAGERTVFAGRLNLSPEVHEKLLELQQKGLDVNQIILEFLEKREEEIAQKKEQIAEEILRKEGAKRVKVEIEKDQQSQSQVLGGKVKIEEERQRQHRILQKRSFSAAKIDGWKDAELEYRQKWSWQDDDLVLQRVAKIGKDQPHQNDEKTTSDTRVQSPSRYIPQAVKKILHEEHGTKCSIRSCQKSAATLHHTQRFSLSGSHDPHYLAPLCKAHHELAHAVDVKYQEERKCCVVR